MGSGIGSYWIGSAILSLRIPPGTKTAHAWTADVGEKTWLRSPDGALCADVWFACWRLESHRVLIPEMGGVDAEMSPTPVFPLPLQSIQ